MSETSATDRPSSRLAESLGARSGTTLGQYELVRRIGTGGMAEVYEAVHRGLKKTVALKVLLPDVADNEDLRARFLREGEAASRIQHPHVVDVTDVGEQDGVPFLVMELLVGDPLSQVIRDHRQLSLSRTLDVLLPIAAALSEAHRRGVVHRDLKPDNIFIARTASGKIVPKLLDFGVSKLTTAGIPSETSRSSVLGTPHYMAPEQALGTGVVGPLADQYAFALVTYECVTGVLPFVSENVVALLHEVSRGVQRPPSMHAAELPPAMDRILLRALSADPRERYEDLEALTDELLPFASQRAAESYRALVERDPSDFEAGGERRLASETTGDFERHSSKRSRRIDEGAATVLLPSMSSDPGISTSALISTDVPSGIPPLSSSTTTQESGSWVPLVVALVALLSAVVGVGVWTQLTEPSPPPDAPVALVPPVPEPVPTPQELADVPLIGAEVDRTVVAPPQQPAAALTRIVVVAFPSEALLELDGELAGRGSLDRSLALDGTPHTLLVEAPGYQPEVITFTTEAPPARIELTRARRPVSSMAQAADNRDAPAPMRPPADDDLRDAR